MRIRHLLGAAVLAAGALGAPAGLAAAAETEKAGGVADAVTVSAEEEVGHSDGEGEEGGHGNFANHEAELCYELLAEGREIDDCQEAPSPILPEANELIWGGLAFLIVLGALSKFGYPAIKKGMEERTNRIRESIDEADRSKAEGQALLADYQRQLADSKAEANRIIDEARTAAESVRAELIARAETEVAELRQRAREDVEAGKSRAMADLQAQVGDLTIELAEKVVGRNIDAETNRQLIDNYIAELGSRN